MNAQPLKTKDLSPKNFQTVVGARYLIEEISIDEATENGIILVNVDNGITRYWAAGYVRRVGNGYEYTDGQYKEMFFKEGDLVMMELLSGREAQLSGKKYRWVAASSVFSDIEVANRG